MFASKVVLAEHPVSQVAQTLAYLLYVANKLCMCYNSYRYEALLLYVCHWQL